MPYKVPPEPSKVGRHARALAQDSMSYRTVKNTLAGGFDRLPAAPCCGPYASTARFARGADDLFTERPGRLH